MRSLPPVATRRPALTRRVGAVGAAVLVGALLVGCSEENPTEVATDSTSDTASESAEPSSEAAPEAAGDLPSWAPQVITDDSDSVTGLDFSGIDPVSDELLVAEVVTGDGPPVESGQTITANYFGQLPDADAPFDESYSRGPFQTGIGVGQVIAGWDQALVGVPVGSRVVMSVPPDLAYGDADNGPIPGGSTLFFVVDIIDAA